MFPAICSCDVDSCQEPLKEGATAFERSGIFENLRGIAAATTVKTNNETAESILADELNKLTFRDRETVNEEIHGIVVDIDKETPESLAESFRVLQTELDMLCSKDRGNSGTTFAFERSQVLFGSNPIKGTYFNSKDLRIMFLRCERFDCQKAALRLCNYANLVYDLYGDIGLERRTRLSDMTERELAIMKMGHCQFLQARDRAGRRVYVHFFDNAWDDLTIKSRIRILAYYQMSILYNDEDCQRMGTVFLFFIHKLQIKADKFIPRGIASNRCAVSLPFRTGAAHYFFPSSDTYERYGSYAVAKIFSRLAKGVKPHVRIHWGSSMECLYTLESFGIPSKHLPIDLSTGEIDLVNNKKWLELRAAREQNLELSKKIIECPKHSDILFGRGQIVMNHVGNVMFRKYIQSKLDTYTSIRSKKESTQWTWTVFRTFKHQYGARFLKEERLDNNLIVWVEVSNETARNKIRIAFRDARIRIAKCTEKHIDSNKNNKNKGMKLNRGDISSMAMAIQTSSSSEGKSVTEIASENHSFSETIPDNYISKISPLMTNQIDDKTTGLDRIFSSLTTPTQQQLNASDIDFNNINNGLRELNNNLRELNSNLNVITNQQDIADKSSSSFLNFVDGGSATFGEPFR